MGLFSSLFGGGKTTTTSNQTSKVTPYGSITPALDKGAGLLNKYISDPNSSKVYQGPRVADMSLDTQRGLGTMAKSQGANDALGFFTNIMNGEAGGMNPAVQQMQDAIKRQVMAANNATFSNSGTVGGTAHQGSLAKGLADGLAQPLFAAYESDMARKMQAGGMLPGIDQQRINNQIGAGQIRDSYAQSKINADMGKFNEQRDAPIRTLQQGLPLAMQMGTAFGTQQSDGTQTSREKRPLGEQLLGAGLIGASFMTGNPMMAMGAGGLGGGGGGGASAPWSFNAPQGSSWFGSPYLAQPGQSQSPLPWRA